MSASTAKADLSRHLPAPGTWQNVLHCSLFAVFWLFSLRFVLVYLGYVSGTIRLAGFLAVIAAAAFAWWRPRWAVYGFIVSVPLVIGVQNFGVVQVAPVLSFGFACLYLGWFAGRLWRRVFFQPLSFTTLLVDFLSAIVILSILANLAQYPLDFLAVRLAGGAYSGQSDPFWCLEAGFFLLQGLFLFRIIELDDSWSPRALYRLFLLLALIIAAFSLMQLFFQMPAPRARGTILNAPFDNVHAYAGYAAFLFFLFLGILQARNWKPIMGVGLVILYFLFILLSSSTTALLATALVGMIYLWNHVSKGKVLSIGFLLLAFILLINFVVYQNENINDREHFHHRYMVRLTPEGAIKKLDGRFTSWDQAAGIVATYPLTGSGIGTFYRVSRHYHITSEPQAWRIENAHNYYVQFTAELGLPALLVFMMIVYGFYHRLYQTVCSNSEHKGLAKGLAYGVGVYLLTMVTDHHLLLPEHQVLFWFAIAAGYTCCPPQPMQSQSNWSIWSPKLWILVVGSAVLVGYLARFTGENRQLRGFEYGYYNPKGAIRHDRPRWTMHQALTRVEAESDLLAVTIRAPSPEVTGQAAEVELLVDGILLERIQFAEEGTVYRYYHLPGIQGRRIDFQTRASHTFNPYKLGLSSDLWQNREQSVAIALDFLRIMPPDGGEIVEVPGWEDGGAVSR